MENKKDAKRLRPEPSTGRMWWEGQYTDEKPVRYWYWVCESFYAGVTFPSHFRSSDMPISPALVGLE